uniref:Uncharacterized protein n=1 Tax=Anguilla anguilla TaxID=7936 RepID=A0A0E9V616_ANGAN
MENGWKDNITSNPQATRQSRNRFNPPTLVDWRKED